MANLPPLPPAARAPQGGKNAAGGKSANPKDGRAGGGRSGQDGQKGKSGGGVQGNRKQGDR